jgi:hypothetical protein
MSLDTVVDAVKARFESLWPSLEASVPVAWYNEDEDWKGNPLPPSRPQPWIMIRVRWNGGEFISIGAPGSNLARRYGNIWVYVFVPRGSGEGHAHRLVAEASSIFEGQDFSGLVCQGMSPGGDVESEDGMYSGHSAAIPFDYDETA